jgi:hypothetical protein
MAKTKHISGALTSMQTISGSASNKWIVDADSSITTDSSYSSALTDKDSGSGTIAETGPGHAPGLFYSKRKASFLPVSLASCCRRPSMRSPAKSA